MSTSKVVVLSFTKLKYIFNLNYLMEYFFIYLFLFISEWTDIFKLIIKIKLKKKSAGDKCDTGRWEVGLEVYIKLFILYLYITINHCKNNLIYGFV